MKMNEELKKYVNAYMDGEDDKTFRIKPKAEDRWQRVIDDKTLLEDMLEFIEELMPYSPAYFTDKWKHQEQYEDLKRRMEGKDA